MGEFGLVVSGNGMFCQFGAAHSRQSSVTDEEINLGGCEAPGAPDRWLSPAAQMLLFEGSFMGSVLEPTLVLRPPCRLKISHLPEDNA